ncbi:MutL DNA mismatch repair enzyme (ATPase) [Pyrenophora tritici-repentis]|uniref:MutL, DNA mismatch repair enzyme (ATPase) n=1 Tax=Pyrenophora tritici-repentis TaxID=45151 RepID=A0A2W1HWD8_9PLEO|nr:MutL DNA mismatch repair enzyme [Pyrenophora tritici-repentis]KAF7567329.1 MutL, DNA mismatch repair enzyme (ATPase) [Pyrenophora tritici-repentis]KAI0573906.1 MutL DNA mismatch repair enzyme (ATPase) [Pyrenophora tritici-repentis]KAI0577774.1 MutL DNA mismatch repair enzyme (ATPase) [Pyrenophora tritici-repentis]KAI0606851.1 MutL DNA mismatch repair enzyme (ATPase) [Pyrenophora tritici-repentis]
MTECPETIPLPGIAALPPTTTRQIGSGQVLVDTSPVVQELIDNALDARAKSMFVDITPNTIDPIQVKDDGHGIPAEDRPLVCRRYCTSKIRDFHDLRNVGGKWLGFRGEALSSMAEMSASLDVTTRVEGELVAVKTKYNRNGELASTVHDSHPVGTTVKVTKFFDYIPVRKQTALKNSSRCLAKIRRLMQAYALARPTTRFRLHVLKAKNSNSDFVYAPKANANIEDAALKVVDKECALQCEWTAMEADGFEVHAFLPKPTANGLKISGQGAFVSVDGRPLSNSRGTIKQIVMAFKELLRKSNSSLAEPAKDDVMFENSEVVLGVFDRLLTSYYPEAVDNVSEEEPPMSAQQHLDPSPEALQRSDRTSIAAKEYAIQGPDDGPKSRAQPRWRSTMYGIDEDDMEFLEESQAPAIDQEEGIRAVEVSNPWTIARMNAAIKPKPVADNGQLLSPAKSQNGVAARSSSPNPSVTPNRPSSARPLTPQTSLRSTVARPPLDEELERSFQRLSQGPSEADAFDDGREERLAEQRHNNLMLPSVGTQRSNHAAPADFQRASLMFPQSSPASQDMSLPAPPAPPKTQRKRQAYANKPFAPPPMQSSDGWPGQQFPGSQPPKLSGRQKRTNDPGRSSQALYTQHPSRLEQTERMTGPRIYSEDESDIRNFFGQSRQPRGNSYTQNEELPYPDSQAPPNQPRARISLPSNNANRSLPLPSLKTRKPDTRDQTSAKEIEAYFLSHDHPHPSLPVRTQGKQYKYHPTLERTKSSRLPLERIPLASTPTTLPSTCKSTSTPSPAVFSL